MTIHPIPAPAAPEAHALVSTAQPQSVAIQEAPEGHARGCRCNDCSRAQRNFLALDRLGAFIEAEAPSLRIAVCAFDIPGAEADLAALEMLDIPSAGEDAALREAVVRMERLLSALTAVPCDVSQVALSRDVGSAIRRDLDARVRWLGARTEDTLLALKAAIG